jgi:hypothetical protein
LNENLRKKAKGVSKKLFFICLERKQGRYRESRQKEVTVEEGMKEEFITIIIVVVMFLFCRLLECGENS